jgi:peptidoglycan/xylan/chitin deacetylase (PgdA/CDA1 family)
MLHIVNQAFNPLVSSHRVLYWHNVYTIEPGLYKDGVTALEFETQIIALKKAGFRFISLAEALNRARSKAKAEQTVSITTDDGFACNHNTILPILKRHGLPISIFLIGKCLDNRALAWNHKLLIVRARADAASLDKAINSLASQYQLSLSKNTAASLFSVPMRLKDAFADKLWELFCEESQAEYLAKHKPFLSSEQLTELIEYGAEIGTHSHSHPDFERLTYPEMLKEIERSCSALQEHTGSPIPYFAYPYGRYNSAAISSKLCRDTSLDLCLGGRYSLKDNRGDSRLWQRQKMEQDISKVNQEILLKPYLRAAKDLLKP